MPGLGIAGTGRAVASDHSSSDLSSFTEHLRRFRPELLPGHDARATAQHGGGAPQVPHGTTIVALSHAEGVVLAGDRRATMGNLIASRDIDKVFVTDPSSAVGIAGTAGIAVELVRLFAVELEHYDKIEGMPLTFDGKANRLATMVRGNLGAAMQGLAVVPLFVGYDTAVEDPARAGRIVSYDIAGGRYEEHAGYHAVGSGSLFAKSALKRMYSPDDTPGTALRKAVEALYDAADDDSATGGPDATRGVYPTAISVTADGAHAVAADRIEAAAAEVIEERTRRSGRA
ncbi:proteasome subunit beta [Tomitella fengzijianii]|uniref:Proteasome subunit beta n=1 Tax=Tomitella fengzijianii TaxID=2597660 RepID=A0A516X2V7_9ACTN|nr:proteasome subunit beta [Tomitella fengzijianii]QDQ97380.1 proteasome subunit beta [Tomitella fengzijianii]